jgi:hypothetical protein
MSLSRYTAHKKERRKSVTILDENLDQSDCLGDLQVGVGVALDPSII